MTFPANTLLVTCCYVNAPGTANLPVGLTGEMVWTTSFTAAGNTGPGFVVPQPPGGVASQLQLEVSPGSGSDWLVSIGKTPDAVNGPRVLVKAGEGRNFGCKPGDILACAPV